MLGSQLDRGGDVPAGMVTVWTAPGSTARSAIPMASTSMTSCRIAPAAGGSSPAAATIIATSDSPIPTRTACRAMLFERRAMRIASASASIRSTVSTTSAASDEAVAPRAASATPTPAAASAGASLTPSPTMIVGAARGLPLDRGELVGRVAVGQHGVDPDDPPDRLRDVGAIAGDQHDPGDPGLAQRPHHPGRVGPDGVLQQERAGRLVVDGDEHGQRAVELGAAAHLAHPWRRGRADDPGRLAEPDPMAADGALARRSRAPPARLRHLQRQPAPGAGGHDGAGQHVRRHLVERGGQAQHLVGANRRRR